MKLDNLAEAAGRGFVFVPNPVVAVGGWRRLLDDNGAPLRRVPLAAYRAVRLSGLSRSGLLDGTRVSTSLTRSRIRRRDFDFRCRSHEPGFEEVMVYHHVTSAIRYVESLGYRGSRAIFTAPLRVDARASRDDNSFYSPSTRSLGSSSSTASPRSPRRHAILDADGNLNDGRHRRTLERIFHRRGIGSVQ